VRGVAACVRWRIALDRMHQHCGAPAGVAAPTIKYAGEILMSSKRPIVLMGILLVLVPAYLTRPLWDPAPPSNPLPVTEGPLPGQNKVSALQVQRDAEGRWMASFEYFYTGAPRPAHVYIELVGPGSAPGAQSA
jgi:hypothetical protein